MLTSNKIKLNLEKKMNNFPKHLAKHLTFEKLLLKMYLWNSMHLLFETWKLFLEQKSNSLFSPLFPLNMCTYQHLLLRQMIFHSKLTVGNCMSLNKSSKMCYQPHLHLLLFFFAQSLNSPPGAWREPVHFTDSMLNVQTASKWLPLV